MKKENDSSTTALEVKAGDIQFVVVAVSVEKNFQTALNDWAAKNPEAVIVGFTYSGTVYINNFVIAVRK